MDWVVITAKFDGVCYVCGGAIQKDDTAYWRKQTGIKHYPQCSNPSMTSEDDTRLVIHDNQDEDFYLK